MIEPEQIHSVLDDSPDDFCLFCEKDTAFDGWGYNHVVHTVDFYCDACGHRKYTLAWPSIEPDLRAEIKYTLDYMSED